MISPVQSYSIIRESSPGVLSIKMGRICWRGRFEPGVKEWWTMRVVMIIEMSWQVNEEVSRDVTGEADGMNQGVVPETGWCISEWAICDFQGQNGWRARKSDNRRGASTARAVKRDQVLKIARLPACMYFEVRERRIYIFKAFIDPEIWEWEW